VAHVDYALVTPARNEEVYIQRTIEAVVSQTVLPQKWVIVSDGSIDRTDEIVRTYAKKYALIQLLRAGEKGQRNFGSKVRAFQAGYDELAATSYEFVGNLDADVTFDPDYYERILQKFWANPKLGVGGGIISELVGNIFVNQNTSTNYSVAGAVQLFRRDCYEAFGGYVPISRGGIDAAAETMARMHGWKVQTFPEIQVRHHRRMSTGGATILHTRFRRGISNYILGYHPLFQIASSLSRLAEKPFLIGSTCTLFGYGWSCLRKHKRAMPDEVVRFLRAEQMARITPSFVAHRAIGGE
jgi:glycosyltransferase involved in cell wall biosynthesis